MLLFFAILCGAIFTFFLYKYRIWLRRGKVAFLIYAEERCIRKTVLSGGEWQLIEVHIPFLPVHRWIIPINTNDEIKINRIVAAYPGHSVDLTQSDSADYLFCSQDIGGPELNISTYNIFDDEYVDYRLQPNSKIPIEEFLWTGRKEIKSKQNEEEDGQHQKDE